MSVFSLITLDGAFSIKFLLSNLLLTLVNADSISLIFFLKRLVSSSTFTVEENQIGVGTVTAADADGDSLSFGLSGTDASSLSISSSGVITFNNAPDYETKTSYSITVNVSDGTNTTSQ